MSVRLTRFTLRGYKSIRRLDDFEPGPINILIGANGAGKSNLISFFRLLNWMMPSPGNLQEHVATVGGANAMLHDGAGTTRDVEAKLSLTTDRGRNDYELRLSHAAGDTFIFTNERYRFSRTDIAGEAPWKELGAGHREARIIQEAENGDETARVILALIKNCVVYQFHNTSATARMRGKWPKDDNRWLKEDAANLAPFLLRLRDSEPKHYAGIVDSIRLIMPFFADFELRPDHDRVMLRWRERNTDMEFSAAQASDGMLRIIALLTLLLQPQDDLPGVLILDEPELGLHPYAVTLIAGLLRSVSLHVQVIVATQSTAFVNCFEPDEIVVVDRAGRESLFHTLDASKLKDWLDEYSIAELWEKNVIGGRPAR